MNDGTYHREQTADNLLSNGSYTGIEDGTYAVNGDEITFSDPLFPPGERFRYTQDAAGNLQLEAVQTDDVIVTVVFTGAPESASETDRPDVPALRPGDSPPGRWVIRLYASEWGGRVLMRGGWGRAGQVTPPAWSRTRSR